MDQVTRQLGNFSIQDPGSGSGTATREYHPGPRPPQVTNSNGQIITFVQDERSGVRTIFQTQPIDAFTDPALYQSGIRGYRYLYAPDANENEQLFPGFRKRDQPKKFFTVGKVFLVLWVEPMGESLMTNFVPGESVGRFGERVYSKVRRFIVIRQAENYCTCLPIMSYGKRGVGKPGVKKSEHSIVYTTKDPPLPLPDEMPSRGEESMRPQAIRIDVDDPTSKLDAESRLDYGKVYTIQHNIKVKSFGKVNPRSMNAMVHQFGNVWNSQPVIGQIGVPDQQIDTSSAGSGRRQPMAHQEAQPARSGKSTGSHGQAEQSIPRQQRSGSHIETSEESQPVTLQQYAQAAVKRLRDRGYSEDDAIAAVRQEYRKRMGGKQSCKDDDNNGDGEGDEDEDGEDSDDDAGRTPSSRQAQPSSRGGRQTQRSTHGQQGGSTVSTRTGQNQATETAYGTVARSNYPAIGQAGPSGTTATSHSQSYNKQQPLPSQAGSTSSVLSQAQPAVVQAMMADYLKKGYTKEQALKLIQQRLSRKGS
jgi:hypothetical protein